MRSNFYFRRSLHINGGGGGNGIIYSGGFSNSLFSISRLWAVTRSNNYCSRPTSFENINENLFGMQADFHNIRFNCTKALKLFSETID